MEGKTNNNFPVDFNTLSKTAKIKFLGEGEPNPIREVTVFFLNEKYNYAVVTIVEIPNNTELKSFSRTYKTQLAVMVCFLILNH